MAISKTSLGEAVVDWLEYNWDGLLYFGTGLLIIFALMFLFTKGMKLAIEYLRKKNEDLAVGIMESIIAPVNWLILTFGVLLNTQSELVPISLTQWMLKIYYSIIVLLFVWLSMRIINSISEYIKTLPLFEEAHFNLMLMNLIRRVFQAVVWIIAFFFIAQNIFHWNITAVLAGAGVVGLAVALAAQNTFANILGAIILSFDRPFKVGDWVKIGDVDGDVIAVGLRSTRIKSSDGAIWTIANHQIVDGNIQNNTLQKSIGYAFKLGLVYSTPPEKMQQAIDLLHNILAANPLIDQKRNAPKIFFANFEDSALAISVTMWFQTTEFMKMQAAKSDINLEILKQFKEAGLEFAYPTSTTYQYDMGNA